MTTTETLLQRLRACPAVRELAAEMAKPYYDGTGWGALVDQTLHLLTTPVSPLWPYYRAVLRVLAEGRDGRWKVVGHDPDAYLGSTARYKRPDGRRSQVYYSRMAANRKMLEARRRHWSRLERGPDKAFLDKVAEVLCA